MAQSSRSKPTKYQRFLREQGGGTAVEYAMIASMIAVALFGAISFLGQRSQNQWERIGNAVDEANEQADANP